MRALVTAMVGAIPELGSTCWVQVAEGAVSIEWYRVRKRSTVTHDCFLRDLASFSKRIQCLSINAVVSAPKSMSVP